MYNNDFTEGRQRTNDDIGYVDIDLSVARTKPTELGAIAGKFIFVSLIAWDDKYTKSTTLDVGEAVLTVNEPNGNPIELSAGMSFEKTGNPIDSAYIRNEAQAGKMIRIYYSVETKLQPLQTQSDVAGALIDIEAKIVANNIDRDTKTEGLKSIEGCDYYYGSSSATLIAAIDNTDGVVIELVSLQVQGSGTVISLLADGEIIDTACNAYYVGGERERIFVDAGKAVTVSVTGSAIYAIHARTL